MPKYIVELWLDGYNTEEEMEAACSEFIYDQLNMTASSVTIEEYNEQDAEILRCAKRFVKECLHSSQIENCEDCRALSEAVSASEEA